MALVVFAFGSVSLVWAMVRAIMTAVPSPCAARAAISSQSVGAQSSEAVMNRPIPPAAVGGRRRRLGGDGQQIGEDAPPDLLEQGAERLR